ncbi:MAG: 50S ribosomal protein L3 [Dehalococcoidia bacterium]|nr:50S ribosomal protein L3 [Dehalococcoidia bacterium]
MTTIGLLGKKVGMTQLFLEDGRVEGVTAVEAGPCVVTQVKTKAKDGYEAVQLGFGEARHLTQPMEGHLRRTSKFRNLRELPTTDIGAVQVGDKVDVSLFHPGDLVDVVGLTKGRGFAGGVKRHGFKGGPKTHGQSDRQRAPGSIGSGTTPGRVIKGLRMAGHMGNHRVTVRNLEVVQVDAERNLLLLRGGLPGSNGGLLLVRQTKKTLRQAQK